MSDYALVLRKEPAPGIWIGLHLVALLVAGPIHNV